MLNRYFLSLCLGLFGLLFSFTAFADANFVDRPEVQTFIQRMVTKYHFNQEYLYNVFSAVKVRPSVNRSVKAPMEKEAAWYTYQRIFITESRIRQGVTFWERNREALAQAERTYGVPASIIVATVGVETKYGKNKGEYPVIDALTNIAFSGSSRSNYFRQELEEFLLLTREQHLNPLTVRGSYAGAMGQPQFMPSSYRHYAVSLNGSSRADLTNNENDIIASVANYYQKHGWKANQMVAIPTLIQRKHYHLATASDMHSSPLSSGELASYGIYPYVQLPANQSVKVIQLKGFHGDEYWVGLHNFDVIKRYNPSDLYAMAVYQLSYYINALRERTNHA
ncbi:MAG: lytic murein transglycosylase B [Gammaproteobacteria bacterium]|nr:lytic murein transglycosylase B [Gammaproteobacteria bacterium]